MDHNYLLSSSLPTSLLGLLEGLKEMIPEWHLAHGKFPLPLLSLPFSLSWRIFPLARPSRPQAAWPPCIVLHSESFHTAVSLQCTSLFCLHPKNFKGRDYLNLRLHFITWHSTWQRVRAQYIFAVFCMNKYDHLQAVYNRVERYKYLKG